MRRHEKGTDVGALEFFFDDAEFSEPIPGKPGTFPIEAALIGQQPDALTKVLAFESGDLDGSPMKTKLLKKGLSRDQDQPDQAAEGNELKDQFHK
jgi:hypothetical protein